MKKNTFLIICLMLLTIFSCNSKTEKSTNTSEIIEEVSQDEFYFTFTIDGKEISIKPDDVSTSYNTALPKVTFKILAGNYGEISVVLTTTADMTKPSSTPSGSTNYDEQITQGSVSLQNYPEKNYVFNSFDKGSASTSVPVPNAFVITKTEKVSDGRIITGTFNVKVFGGDNKKNDPNIKDRMVVGKFRIKHTFSDTKF
ncbi:hypothetical protein VB796_08535 [Arcicella sp. LKC2W]|uniref:hypothetical protein n=1 Tax=Arcicella sp. LKC2W TaxID=2984198 RepID=UPI002B219FEE|nr:hypothetical protein [Arcicella sp. LKC2W]MEA5459081.1 hypothetical protein [Arcicella sp. LKC2W]